jgi:hypothetical protein
LPHEDFDDFLLSECHGMDFNGRSQAIGYLSIIMLDYFFSLLYFMFFVVFFCFVFAVKKVEFKNPRKVIVISWNMVWITGAWLIYQTSKTTDIYFGSINQVIVASVLGFRVYMLVTLLFLFVRLVQGKYS